MRTSRRSQRINILRVLFAFLLVGFVLLPFQQAVAIPFFSKLPAFSLYVQGDPQLQEKLTNELNELRKNSSALESYENLRDIAHYERGNLEKLLRAEGYYDATVRESVQGSEIIYQVFPGPQYLIKSLDIEMPANLRAGFPGLPISIGDPLQADEVLEGVQTITRYLNENACLLNVDVTYQATVIHQEAAARLVYRVAPSPEVLVGEVEILGATSVEDDYLRSKLNINPGDCFSRSKLDAAQLRLLRTNLISNVTHQISEPYNGLVDVIFIVQERNHRTITLGVGYTSDEGPGVSASWEHRNIFHRGEKLEVESKVNKVKQTLESKLTIPRFFRDKQRFTASVALTGEDVDSYSSKALTLKGLVSRKLSKHRTISGGAELKFSRVDEKVDGAVEDGDPDENYHLLAFPLGFKLNTTDKPLDARRGATTALEIKPYVDLKNNSTSFVKNILQLTAYKTAQSARYEPTLALRIKAGAITGAPNLELPADERFYAGGGGSVRGYGYQELGPRIVEINEDGQESLSDAIGGRGLSEISIEGRFRFSKTWGGVLFLDGGNAYENPRPNFSNLFWGAGFGVRYNTSFAPIRFDLAFPLDRRDGVDDHYQVYVSLGQAF
ncbi:BamA/TamA family outer membrane protein [Microbulbifer variabilis]|uniref:BamA/TamA family outer membrane protein n=1 Tax=Microbulbifer variabilis TaxID=266805 RepID=A0ABY4V905_9GAMM|nr:BamA/TamA family outer membrane protein [Microbulbifer variabilis]USD20405.1 BamA/TamA family outer membrane protein [Microbulbifer variabilis]